MTNVEKETQQFERDYDYIIKIIVVGDSEVGKSQLVQRFLKNTFNEGNEPTVAFDYATKIMEVKGKVLRIHLWDMAGRSIFRSMTQAYYQGAAGAMIVYDITKVLSFDHAKQCLDQVQQFSSQTGSGMASMLVGNKLDKRQQRSVAPSDGINMAKNSNSTFIETSAKDSVNVQKAFRLLVEDVYDRILQARLRRDVTVGRGLENGAKSLLEKPEVCQKCDVTVVQKQPQKISVLRKVAQRCVEESKATCTKYCCF